MIDDLKKQFEFILELDKMKNVYRQTSVLHENRKENDAEHSWHLAIIAFILSGYSNEKLDLLKVVKMVLFHDVVEIDAGDTYCYDEKGNESRQDREQLAAKRLFGILPENQGAELINLWQEFEERKTPEAKFAAALDRIQPVLLITKKHGESWAQNNITYEQVIKRNGYIKEGSNEIWEAILGMIDDAFIEL